MKYVTKSKLDLSKIKSIKLKNNSKFNIETTLRLKKSLFFNPKELMKIQLLFKLKYMVKII